MPQPIATTVSVMSCLHTHPLSASGVSSCSSSSTSFLELLPNVLVVWIADRFLADVDANAVARTHRYALHALGLDDIKRELPLAVAAQWPRNHTTDARRFGRVTAVRIEGDPGTNTGAYISPNMPAAVPLLHEAHLISSLPSSVTRLSTHLVAHLLLAGCLLPPRLRCLRLGPRFRSSLAGLVLPDSLEELDLVDSAWNQPAADLPMLPSNLLRLAFSRSLQDSFPAGDANARPLQLPRTLTYLDVGRNFTGSLQYVQFPRTLLSLHLGNSSIEGVPLPPSLTQLWLGDVFEHSLRNWDPPASLTDFQLGEIWNLPCDQLKLPSGPAMRRFQFPRLFTGQSATSLAQLVLPPALTQLQFGSSRFWPMGMDIGCSPDSAFDQPLHRLNFPTSLRSLHLGSDFNQPLGIASNGDFGAMRKYWPASLTHLVLSTKFTQALLEGHLPPTLLVLDMSLAQWNRPLQSDLRLPRCLHSLILPHDPFDQPLLVTEQDYWPESLTSLELGDNYVLPLVEWTFPRQLRKLRLGHRWELPSSQLRCPITLHTLIFGESFNQSVGDLVLPPSLRVLRMNGFMFNQPVAGLRLPDGLEELQLGSNILTGSRPFLRLVGAFNQPLNQLRLPVTLQWLCLPSSNFCQPRASLPTTLPPALRVLRLHSPARMEASGWAELPLPRTVRIEFGPPIDDTITTRVQKELQAN